MPKADPRRLSDQAINAIIINAVRGKRDCATAKNAILQEFNPRINVDVNNYPSDAGRTRYQVTIRAERRLPRHIICFA